MDDKSRALVWAIDPFQDDVKPDSHAVTQLMAWVAERGWGLQPVFVLSRPSLDLAKYTGDTLSGFVIAHMREKVANHLRTLGVENANPCEVILAHSTAHEEAINDIEELAVKCQSPWILVSSHGRSGLSRMAFGSFAEALVIHSRHPVLFLPRTHHEEAHMSHLLFPTDFSAASHVAFRHLLEDATASHLKITLYYSNVWPTSFSAGLDLSAPFPPGFLEEEEAKARAEADIWIAEAKTKGVDAEFQCRYDGSSYDIGQSILAMAGRTQAGWISMTCGTHSIASFFTGSIARDVFHAGEFPVLVYGPASTTEFRAETH